MSEPPTQKEIPILNQFRERMQSQLKPEQVQNDAFLMRWLRARDMDLDKASLMLTNSLKWRKENNVDYILNKPASEEWAQVINIHTGGLDKLGRPVLGIPSGEWEVRKQLDEGRKEELNEFTIQVLETFAETLELMWRCEFPQATPTMCTKFTIIIDLKGITYAKMVHKKSMELLLEVIKSYEANYPETLGHCIIINSPRIFAFLFGMIKPFLSEATVSKISIFDSNEKEWKAAVREIVDEDQIIPKYGGNKTDISKFT